MVEAAERSSPETLTGNISDEEAGPPREKQMRYWPARLIEEEAEGHVKMRVAGTSWEMGGAEGGRRIEREIELQERDERLDWAKARIHVTAR